MEHARESKEPKGQKTNGKNSLLSGAATRIWLVATGITLAIVMAAGGAIYFHHEGERQRLEAQYSRLAAHFAEEADLRIQSYRRAASVIGNALSWYGSERTLDALVNAADESAAKGTPAKGAPKNTQRQKTQLTAAARKAAAAEGAAGKEWELARQREQQADDAFKAADAALKAAIQDAEQAKAVYQAANAPAPADGGFLLPVNSRDAQTAKATLETVLLRQRVAQTNYEEAQKALILAHTATDASGRALTDAATKESALVRLAMAANATEAVASRSERQEQAEKARDKGGLLSFFPPPSECRGAPDFDRCYAQALVENLFRAPEQPLPLVVSCPRAAHDAVLEDPPVLIEGRHALFRIPRKDLAHTAEEKKAEAAKPQDSRPAPNADASPPKEEKDLCLRVRVDQIVPFAAGRTVSRADVQNAFDEVLLADGKTCQVLAWSDTDPQVRPSTLPHCAAAMTLESDPASGGGSGKQEASKQEPKQEEKKSDRESDQGAGLAIGGSSYHAFWQPLRSSFQCESSDANNGLDAATACGPGRSLVVAGLVRDGRMRDQIRGLSPLVFLFVVALAALAVFSWPVAKLWLVGARARFTRFDSVFLATSALAGTLIIALVVMTLIARECLTKRLDDQLTAVATELTTRLSAEMTAASGQLDGFLDQTKDVRAKMIKAGRSSFNDLVVNREVSKACDSFAEHAVDPGPRRPPAPPLYDVQWPDLGSDKRWPVCDVASAVRMTAGSGPNASTAFWANDRGDVQIETSDLPVGSPPVNVAARRYFRQARDEAEEARPHDVVEVVRSLASTRKVLVVSRSAEVARDQRIASTAGVVAFETNLDRFEKLGIPPGIQWAAIDQRGKVMLHSSIDDHHGHDLFDDLDPPTENDLRAAMLAAKGVPFDGEYRGVRSRFFVRSNQASNWFVVAIGSRGTNEAITRNTLITASSAFGLFVLVLALVVIGLALHRIARSDGDYRPSLLDPRPRGDSSRVYARVFQRVGIGSAVLLALTLVCPWIPTMLLLLAAVTLLLVSARELPGIWPTDPTGAGASAEVPPKADESVKTWRDRLTLTYPLCCFGFATAFVVVPATICFVGSFSLATRSALRSEQLLELPRPDCDAAVKGPSCPKVVAHLEPSLVPREAQDAPPNMLLHGGMLWPLETVMKSIPDYISGATHTSCVGNDSRDRCLKWVEADSKLRLVADKESWMLVSSMPRLLRNTNYGHLALGALGVALLLLAAHAAAYVSLKRLFFLDCLIERDAARTKDEERRQAPEASGPVLYLFPPPDLLKGPEATEPGTVVLRAEDPWSAPEAMIASVKGATLVLAEVDPLRRGPANFRDAWADALKGFAVIRGRGRPPTHVAPGDSPNPAVFAHEWKLCDPDEQRVLAQLAFDGHVSPHPSNGPVLRHLAARGLVDDLTLSIADPAFARYLAHSIPSEQLEEWEGGETDVAWSVVRVPLLTSVALIIGLVLMSHPELAESGALLLPPVAGTLPVLLRFVAMLTGKGKQDELPA